MSVRDIQLRQVIEKALRAVLQKGDPPRASFISSKVYEEFSQRAPGAPRFWPALWSKRKPIPIDGYNRNIEELEQDFNTLFTDANNIQEETLLLDQVILQEVAAAETRLKRIQERIDRLLLELAPAQDFTLWHRENFSSMEGTDLGKTSALLDFEHQRLSMPQRLRSMSVLTYEDVDIKVSSSGQYRIITPLEWMFSHYENESTEIIATQEEGRARIVLDVHLKRRIAPSRIRISASSGSSYGLKIDVSVKDGELMTVHDRLVSFPLEIPVNEEAEFIRFTFDLSEPIKIEDNLRTFRLLIHRLEIFEEWTSGTAEWVSRPIELPRKAIWGRVEWVSNISEGEYVDGTIQLINEKGELISTVPVRSGSIFPIRAKVDQTLEVKGSDFNLDTETSTLPLYKASLGISPSAEILAPQAWIGIGQWKQRMFYDEWAEGLSPQHLPGPMDWAEFIERAIMPDNTRLLFVDHGSNLYLVPRPSDRNSLIALSTYVVAPEPYELVIPSFQVENANFTLYANGQKLLDHDEADSPRKLTIPLNQGINSLQIYLMTRGESEFGPPLVSFGDINWGPTEIRAVRDPMIWVSPYTIRRASPAHPLYWASIQSGNMLIRFSPAPYSDSRTHTRFRINYSLPGGSEDMSAIITLRMTKEEAGPGMGPSVSQVSLFTSSTGGP